MDNRLKLKTDFFNLIGIMAIETLAFVWLISGSKYDPSVAIGIILFIPLLFGLNIQFGSLLLMLKLKNTSLAVFANAIASPLAIVGILTIVVNLSLILLRRDSVMNSKELPLFF
ncbi:MAG: hypothetical protein ACK5PF_03095 [bacterium]